jgi:DNA polymerase III epsilon subunit-like protein
MRPGLISQGKSILCGFDVETTGLICGHHEITQIAFVPVTADLKPFDGIPFYSGVRPERPELINIQAMNTTGLTQEILDGYPPREVVEHNFHEWYRQLDLPVGYRLQLLGHNLKFDEPFLREFIGEKALDDMFAIPARDTMTVGAYLNDRAAMRCQNLPFARLQLGIMAKRLGIDTPRSHDALGDVLTTIDVYRELLLML